MPPRRARRERTIREAESIDKSDGDDDNVAASESSPLRDKAPAASPESSPAPAQGAAAARARNRRRDRRGVEAVPAPATASANTEDDLDSGDEAPAPAGASNQNSPSTPPSTGRRQRQSGGRSSRMRGLFSAKKKSRDAPSSDDEDDDEDPNDPAAAAAAASGSGDGGGEGMANAPSSAVGHLVLGLTEPRPPQLVSAKKQAEAEAELYVTPSAGSLASTLSWLSGDKLGQPEEMCVPPTCARLSGPLGPSRALGSWEAGAPGLRRTRHAARPIPGAALLASNLTPCLLLRCVACPHTTGATACTSRRCPRCGAAPTICSRRGCPTCTNPNRRRRGWSTAPCCGSPTPCATCVCAPPTPACSSTWRPSSRARRATLSTPPRGCRAPPTRFRSRWACSSCMTTRCSARSTRCSASSAPSPSSSASSTSATPYSSARSASQSSASGSSPTCWAKVRAAPALPASPFPPHTHRHTARTLRLSARRPAPRFILIMPRLPPSSYHSPNPPSANLRDPP